MKRKGEGKGVVFRVGVKGEGNEFGDEIFCEIVIGEGVMAGLGDGKGVIMGWNILEEIFWWKGVEYIRRMEKVLEYGGRKRKRKEKKRKGKIENLICGEIKNN